MVEGAALGECSFLKSFPPSLSFSPSSSQPHARAYNTKRAPWWEERERKRGRGGERETLKGQRREWPEVDTAHAVLELSSLSHVPRGKLSRGC